MALEHDLPLLTTIAAGLSLAFVLGLVASKIRIPPIVGYLVAGVVIGPFTDGYVADVKLAEELSEIGIVLMMFGVGLHFSMRDLLDVKKIALPGAVTQIAAAMLLGAAVSAYWWDWKLTEGLMFGLALSTASTVVLLRTLEENNLIQSTNGRIAIGWLIVEDLAMILALVLIPALAQISADTGTATGFDAVIKVAIAIGKVVLFVTVMQLGGKRFLPWVLTMVARTNSRELFTLAVFATAVGVAYGAAMLFDVSFALGAFFAGMMIRESDLNHEVADRALPFQDAFAVLFFVAVGMLFNPATLGEQPYHIFATLAIIIVGKSLAAMMIVILLRYPLKTALLVSASLAQIGEFSFILVGLGIAYDFLPPEGRDLILAGAIISIALNPVIFRFAQYVYQRAGNSPRLSALFNVDNSDLSHLRRGEKQALRDLVIMVGHGSVGRHIARTADGTHLDFVIIDNNRERVDLLREQGRRAIAGDATYPEVLQKAAIEKAIAIVISIPNPFEAGKIVETVRELNPNAKILLCAHNDGEMEFFESLQADVVLTGPREVALTMVDYLKHIEKPDKNRPEKPAKKSAAPKKEKK